MNIFTHSKEKQYSFLYIFTHTFTYIRNSLLEFFIYIIFINSETLITNNRCNRKVDIGNYKFLKYFIIASKLENEYTFFNKY